jgi:uncharacterized GH25 family protein
MQRSLLLAFVLLLLGIAAGMYWFLRDGPAPLPASTDPSVTRPEVGAAALTDATARKASEDADGTRQVVAAKADLLDDPEIRAGLCGFKGRIVDHKKVPVGDCGVRIYRGAPDSVLPANFDLLAADIDNAPQYIAGEVRTAADGTWQMTGVWPRAFYLLYGGIGTDAPTHQIVARTPSPGEIVDLGDIVLNDAGVLVGTVVDDNGDPLPGALVRAADVPGTIAALFPIERIDPEGAVLVRASGSPVRVVEFPKWAKQAWEHLPVPSTRTTADGRFRLVGVAPGSNMLAVTAPQFLSDVKPSVPVRPGQQKDVGTIKLKRGEELTGRVVDTKGEPVANAEVFAGSMSSMAPMDVAQRLAHTDAQGRFTGQGYSAGKVTVAARRGPGHAWVLADPQPILGDVVVTLPATFAVDATITLTDGTPATAPRLRLLQGRVGDGAAEMFLLGVSQPIELKGRSQPAGDGKWRIENLNAGSYTLLADAPGHALAFATFDITDKDTSVVMQLGLPTVFTVRVLAVDGAPIRNAAIYANATGKRAIDMPTRCGHTGHDGVLRIDSLQGESVRVSADHPKWGTVHGEVKAGAEVTLVMLAPGSLHGIVRENGKPPDLGKFTISVERRSGDGEVRGALESVPVLLSPGLDGTFATKALQPGNWRAQAIPALEALRSPGSVIALAQNAMMQRDTPRQSFTIASGQSTEVVLEAGAKPIDGPAAQLAGTATVDGRMAAGSIVIAWAKAQRFAAKVDDKGRFDLGRVPAGDLRVSMSANSGQNLFGSDNNLWSGTVKLAQDEVRELTIDVQTSSIRGHCLSGDGTPAAGVFVQGQGKLKGVEQHGDTVWIHATTNAEGEFHFAQVAEGTWELTARANNGGPSRGRAGMRGSIPGIVTTAGLPVTGLRMQLLDTVEVKGRLDLTVFGGKRADWAWMSIHQLKDGEADDAPGEWADGSGVDQASGAFTIDSMLPGRYRVELHAGFDDDAGEYPCGILVVGPRGLTDVVLRPGPRRRR